MSSTAISVVDSVKARLKTIWTAGDYDRFHGIWKAARGSFTSDSTSRRVANWATSPVAQASSR
jgi:hypothetical protein